MPPSQSLLSRHLRTAILTLTLGGTPLACATSSISLYGFDAAPDVISDVDVAWFLVADAATKTYNELAMVNFVARQINFRIVATEGKPRMTPGTLHVKPAKCLADSDLLPVFAAIVGHILQRDVMLAALAARERLLPACGPNRYESDPESPEWFSPEERPESTTEEYFVVSTH